MQRELLNIIFLGEDSFSDIVLGSLIKAGHKVKLVITPYYENLIYKRLELTCRKNNIEFRRCRNVNSEEIRECLIEYAPDLCVVSHFEKLIKPEMLSIPRLGFINLHPSLLPYYRGMSPQHWPIINGEKETGITVHFIDKGIDTGDIIIQKHIVIDDDMYVFDLQNKWCEVYKDIVIDAIDLILSKSLFVDQKYEQGSYYGRLRPEQCCININDSVRTIYNLIKGVSKPYYGASYDNILIWKAHPVYGELKTTIEKLYEENGIYMNTDFGSILRCSDGVLIIDKYNYK